MAHQAENIPWHDVASIVRPEFVNVSKLVPHGTMEDKFEQTLKREAQLERQKYPESFTVPQDDETVITDEIVALILPTMKRGFRFKTAEQGDERIEDIPPETRKMIAFTAPWYGWGTDDDVEAPDIAKGDEKGSFQMEIIKALLVHGQLEPVLRICAHPRVDLNKYHNVNNAEGQWFEDGWDTLYTRTLEHYLFYNVLFCIMGVWKGEMENNDYRDLENFQNLWYRLSQDTDMTDICTHLHRTLLGMPDHFEMPVFYRCRPIGGQAPFVDFVEACEHTPKIHVMSRETLRLVQSILAAKKLPPELQQYIVMLTGQEKGVESCLVVPYDPLHSGNRRLLLKYLERCWKQLLHCHILSQGHGNTGASIHPGRIDWKNKLSVACFMTLV